MTSKYHRVLILFIYFFLSTSTNERRNCFVWTSIEINIRISPSWMSRELYKHPISKHVSDPKQVYCDFNTISKIMTCRHITDTWFNSFPLPKKKKNTLSARPCAHRHNSFWVGLVKYLTGKFIKRTFCLHLVEKHKLNLSIRYKKNLKCVYIVR